jgi:hypothetical protein
LEDNEEVSGELEKDFVTYNNVTCGYDVKESEIQDKRPYLFGPE